MDIESELKIITTVIANQFIYDKLHPSYRNILIRNKFWKRLSDELCLNELTCRQRYKSLRDHYVAESKRVASGGEEYSPKCRHYNEFKFMFDCAALGAPYLPIPSEQEQHVLFISATDDLGVPPPTVTQSVAIVEQTDQTNSDMMDLEIAIIEAVRSNPFLYNRKHKYYRKMKVRSKFWKQLSVDLNCDEKLCRQKYKTLRDQYAVDAKRVKKIDEFHGVLLNGSSKFRHFDRLSFLSGDIELLDESEPTIGKTIKEELEKNVDGGNTVNESELSSFNNDDEYDVTLINAIYDNPFLYDKKNPDYTNSVVQCEFWRTFSERIGVNEKICRTRFKNLHDKYEAIVRQINLVDNKDANCFLNFKHFKKLLFLSINEPPDEYERIKRFAMQSPNIFAPDFDFMNCDDDEKLLLPMKSNDTISQTNEDVNNKMENDENIISTTSPPLKQQKKGAILRSHYPSKVYQDDFEISLIEAAQDNPFLYDKSHSNYRNTSLRCEFWNQLSKHIGVKERICRTRFRSLRDKFALLTRRIKSNEAEKHSCYFRHFRKLLFLLINESIEDRKEIESKASLFCSRISKKVKKPRRKTKSTFVFVDDRSSVMPKMLRTEDNITLKATEAENDKSIKCGEAFYMGNGMINYQCFLCCTNFIDGSQFTEHIIDHFAKEVTADKNNIKTTKIVSLETTICNAEDDNNEIYDNISVSNENKLSETALTWKCDQCDERFVCSGQKDNHEDIFHDILQPVQCNWCTAWFETDKEHTKHEELHAQMLDNKENDLVTCVYCQQLFENQLAYEKHCPPADYYQNQSNSEKNKKDKLKQNFQKKKLNRQISSSSSTLPVKCEFCDKSFSRRHISHHMRVTHSIKPEESIECKLCNQYYGQQYIIRHFRSKHDPNKTDIEMQCPVCDLFVLPKQFLSHYNGHLKVDADKIKILTLQLISCKICKKIMHTNSYNDHLFSVHNKNNRIQCTICNIFVRTEYLRTHQRKCHESTVEERRKFECHVCKRKFTEMTNLRIHMRIHTGERPYKCPICLQTFRQGSNIQEHIRINHTNERPFLCAECGKGFVAHRLLNYHMKMKHSGLPPPERLQCHLCSKTLKNNCSLQKHIAITHSIVRPFVCTVCGNAFKCMKTLSSHLLLHSDEKRYVCKYCGQRFAQIAGKRSHERRVHEESQKYGLC